MAAFRPVPALTVFFDNLGQPCAGGELQFFDTLTLDAKNVYSDEDLSVNLGNTVTLDSAGRAPSDVWGSGVYRIRLYTSDAELVDEADPVQEEGAAGSAIPSQTGNSGEFLTTNGTVMSWAAIREVPDPTGSAGKYLTTDGSVQSWGTITVPDVPADGIETGTKLFRIGGFQVIAGTETMPITGTHTATKAVTFATPFNAEPYYIACFNATGPICPSGAQGVIAAQSQSATGFTISHDVNIDSVDAGWNISVAAVVKWIAFGPVTP